MGRPDSRLLFAAGVATAVALALLTWRGVGAGDDGLAFLAWNVLLAWAPLAVLLPAARIRGTAPRSVVLLAWLALFPNTLYPVTDFIHLRGGPLASQRFDLALLATVAVTAVLLTGANLMIVRRTLRAAHGARVCAWAMRTVVVLTGVGIYIGRILQWNSWDLVVRPLTRVQELLLHLADPRAVAEAVVMSMTAALTVWLIDCAVRRGVGQPRSSGDAWGVQGSSPQSRPPPDQRRPRSTA